MNSTTTTDEEARMQFEDRERARAERNVEHEEPAPEPAASQGGAQSPCRDAPEPAASPGVAQSPCRNEHRDKFPGTKCAGCSSRWVMKKVCPHHPDLVWCSNCHNNHAKVCNDNGIARMSHLPQESWVPGKARVVCERRQDDAQPYSNRSLCPDCRLHYCSQCYEAHIDRCVPGSWRLKSAASQDSARQCESQNPDELRPEANNGYGCPDGHFYPPQVSVLTDSNMTTSEVRHEHVSMEWEWKPIKRGEEVDKVRAIEA